VLKKASKCAGCLCAQAPGLPNISRVNATALLKMTYAYFGQTRPAFLFCTTGEPVGWGGAVPSGILPNTSRAPSPPHKKAPYPHFRPSQLFTFHFSLFTFH
jgi:hypothetical protein